jgi:glycosyltransferase involved in cell wall biosynthesis
MRKRERPLLVIGMFPPPVHGQAVLTEKIAEFFEEESEVRRVSLAAPNPVGKIVRAFTAAARVLLERRGENIYATPPGQKGLWLFSVIVLAARLRGQRVYVHHHSFRPISAGPLAAMRLLNSVGGSSLRHIFLGERMREGFARVYAREPNATVLPNAFAFPPPTQAPPLRTGPLTIGHLSVLSRTKGVLFVLELFDLLRAAGVEVNLVLAGPIADKTLVPFIDAAASKHGAAFAYVGPVYGTDKFNFFQRLDLFLMPSTLLDEADPLVIQEAYESGVEVMATDRGCIRERLRRSDAFLTLEMDADVKAVSLALQDISRNRQRTARLAWEHAAALHADAYERAIALRDELLASGG